MTAEITIYYDCCVPKYLEGPKRIAKWPHDDNEKYWLVK